MRRFLLLVLLSAGPALAQVPDTLDPRGYFPLAVGNEWEYEVRLERPIGPNWPTDDSRTEYHRVRIVGAAYGDAPHLFTLVEERFAEDGAVLARDTAVVRYDAESASVLTTGVGPSGTPYERPAPSFAADLDLPTDDGEHGEWRWSWASYLDEGDGQLGVPAFVRDPLAPVAAKEFWDLGGGIATAVHGFGFVAIAYYPDGCQHFCHSDAAALTFAVVDGRTFGARAVGVEAPLERRDPGPLVVYPNPTAGRVTVEARSQGGGPVAVYDVAGRLVRSAVVPLEGTASFDLGGLSPGLYVIRLGGRVGRVVVR